MSLTYGPKHFQFDATNASQVKVLKFPTMDPASLDVPVTVYADGSFGFTVSTSGLYIVQLKNLNGFQQERVSLTSIPTYDITDPRSYANSAPGVANGATSAPGSGSTEAGVLTVAGKSGPNVTLVPADVNLGQVNNTADLDKPISNSTQAALNTINSAIATLNSGFNGLSNSISLLNTAIATTNSNVTSIFNTATANTSTLGAHDTRLATLESNISGVVRKVNNTTPDANGNVNIAVQAGSVESANITDSTGTGRSILTAVSGPAVRSIIGAGTSSLVLGTTSGTAKDGSYRPAAADVSDATTIGVNLIRANSAATARTVIDAASPTEVDARINAIIGAAPGALDTLSELAAALDNNSSFASSVTDELALKAYDSQVVKLTGAQTVAGVKTFSSAPVVPANAFAMDRINGLSAALSGKSDTAHTHTSSALTDSTAIGRGVITAVDGPAIRTLIGAGTSSLALGTTGTTAKAGNYQPAAANISDATATGISVITAASQSAARTAIGAGTSSLALGTTSSTAKAGDYQPTAANISDATAIGRSVLTGVDAPTIRAAIGAGISSLALGSASGTAADASTVVLLTGNQTLSGTKTFSAAPVFPTNSIPQDRIQGLTTALLNATNVSDDTDNALSNGTDGRPFLDVATLGTAGDFATQADILFHKPIDIVTNFTDSPTVGFPSGGIVFSRNPSA